MGSVWERIGREEGSSRSEIPAIFRTKGRQTLLGFVGALFTA